MVKHDLTIRKYSEGQTPRFTFRISKPIYERLGKPRFLTYGYEPDEPDRLYLLTAADGFAVTMTSDPNTLSLTPIALPDLIQSEWYGRYTIHFEGNVPYINKNEKE